MIYLGYFLLGFILVFFGGLWWLGKWEIFDIYEDEHRSEVITHLKYIKEKVDANYNHLEKVNGRLRNAENNITGIKATGITLYTIVGIILTWLGISK